MTRTRGRRIGTETLTLDPIPIPKSVKTERSKIQISRNAEGEKEKQGRWLTSPLPSPSSCGKDRIAPMFVAEMHPRGYGYRASTRSRLTAARSPDGERARRQEGPRWRRLRLLLRRGSLSLECVALLRETRAREKGSKEMKLGFQGIGRGAVLFHRSTRSAVRCQSTAVSARAAFQPRRD